VLLPTHNRADVLPYAIRSVQAQSIQDFEILIMGDGCTDNTAAVVASFMEADSRIRWFDLPKAPSLGYANRNIVLKQARGELIAFMAHDDIASSDHLAILAKALEDPRIQIAHTGSAWIGVDGTVVPTLFHLQDARIRKAFLELQSKNRIPATSYLHRRGVFERAGYYHETIAGAGDCDLWNRIIQANGEESLKVIGTTTAFHFRAVWRKQNLVAPDNESIWKFLHESPGRLPTVLKVETRDGETEQAAFWRFLTSDPDAIFELRDGLNLAMQSLGWELELAAGEHVPPSSPGYVSAVQKKLARQTERAERLRQELDRTKGKLAILKEKVRQLEQKPPGRFSWPAGKRKHHQPSLPDSAPPSNTP